MNTHPLFEQLNAIKHREKKRYTMMFWCMTYYERLSYSKTLIDYFSCPVLPKQMDLSYRIGEL